MRKLFFLGAIVTMTACTGSGEIQSGNVGSASDAANANTKIVGGSTYSGLPAVGEVTRTVSGGYVLCTGTLIAPAYVLTAAHCIDQNTAESDRGDVTFTSTDANQGTTHFTSTHVSIPAQYFTDTVGGYDLALVHLSTNSNATPFALMANETTADLGNQVFLVGYGLAAANGTGSQGAGIKRSVNATVDALDANFLWFGNAQGDSCNGDSGGPVLHERSDGSYEIAATVRGGTYGNGTPKCEGLSFGPRVDTHLAWIQQVAGVSTTPPAPVTGNPNIANPNTANPNTQPVAGGVSCPNLGTWDANSVAFEAQVLDLVNQARSKGANCNTGGTFGPQGALSVDPGLVCLARAYAQDMQVNNFFSHTDQNGKSPFDRMAAAGITFTSAGENIAEGQTTPQQVVSAWLASDGHCANIMGGYTLTGIGFYKNYWVQDFIHP